jgi:hypothetical protein
VFASLELGLVLDHLRDDRQRGRMLAFCTLKMEAASSF